MKTSDKLLLTLALVILGVFGAIQFSLYARLKAGHINSMHSREGWTRCYNGTAPSRIVVKGNINLTLGLSDRTVVDVQEGAKVNCRMAGDSLVIEGDSFVSINPHSLFQNYGSLPWMSLDVPAGAAVHLDGQLALLQGTKQPGRPSLNITAVNSQLWLGETYGTGGEHYPVQYYDSVHIQEINSSLIVHRNAVIAGLSAHLDGQSEFTDHSGSLSGLDLQYMPESKISIKGATLDQLKK